MVYHVLNLHNNLIGGHILRPPCLLIAYVIGCVIGHLGQIVKFRLELMVDSSRVCLIKLWTVEFSLNTILIYIILKLRPWRSRRKKILSTILIYIILKPQTSNSKMTGLIKPNVLILKPLKYVILQQRNLPVKYYPKFPLNSPIFQKSQLFLAIFHSAFLLRNQ